MAVALSYESINGTIVSDWKLEGDTFRLNVTIPANTTARVYVPTRSSDNVTEGGQPADSADGVRLLRRDHQEAVYAVGSGDYQFASRPSGADRRN